MLLDTDITRIRPYLLLPDHHQCDSSAVMDDLNRPSRSGSFVPNLGPSITVTKVASSSESTFSAEIHQSMEDDVDFKIDEDDIKIEEEENVLIEVVDDVSREDTETEKMCDLCPAVFKSGKSLQRHMKVKHDTRECICPECGISVVGMQKLAHHRRLHQTFRCPSCDQEFGMNQRSRQLKILL